MDKENKVNLIGSIILLGFAADALYHFIMIFFAHYDYPYTTFLFAPSDRFKDYFNMCNIAHGINPYFDFGEDLFPSNYLPFAHILFYLFSLSPICVFRYLVVLFAIFFAYFNFRFLFSKEKPYSLNNVVLYSFFTYPFLFVSDSRVPDISIFMPLNILILVTMVFMIIISGVIMRLSRMKTSGSYSL